MKEDIYSDLNAMNYEYLIRRVYNCGRNYKKGADADIYRRFIRKARIFKDKQDGKFVNSIKTEQDLLNDYQNELVNVVHHIDKAILHTLNNHSSVLSNPQLNDLKECRLLLDKPSVSNVVSVIAKAEKIMIDIGLYPS